MAQGSIQDWKNSPAHLQLYSYFVKPETFYRFTEGYMSSDWRVVLKEPPAQTLQMLIKDGYLIRPDLVTLINYKFKLFDLKELCRERHLPVSGKKAELVERLLTADKPGMQIEVKDVELFVCSEKGKHLADAYLETKEREREEAEKVVLDYLRQKNFLQATRTVAKFEAKQVFIRGMGIDWDEEYLTPNPHNISTLEILFDEIPTIAQGMDPEKLEYFRIVAGFFILWGDEARGKRLLDGIENVYDKFCNTEFVRMLWSYANNKCDLREWREMARVLDKKNYKVEIHTANDEYVCDNCKQLAKEKYPLLGDVPELPNPNCSHACRCVYALDFGF